MEDFDKFVEKFSDKSLLWCFGFGFISVFMLGFVFIVITAITASILQWIGFNNSLGIFIDKNYATSEFYSSERFFAFVIYGNSFILIGISFVIWWHKQGERMFPIRIENEPKIKKDIVEKYIDNPIKKLFIKFKKLLWRPSSAIIVLIIFAILIIFSWNNIGENLGLLKKFKECTEAGQFYRNRGFFIFAIFGVSLTVAGMLLTFWGRTQTQEQLKLNRESNASERYENAARMLGDPVLAVRIAGCQALRSLGLGYNDMAVQCVNLLLAYINNPFISEKKLAGSENLSEEKKIKEFPLTKRLRADIQVAAINMNAICEKYYEEGKSLNLGFIDLPKYFWQNLKKGTICLPNSIIVNAQLKKTNLSHANLAETKFYYANFEKTIFHDANLRKARLTSANLKKADLSWATLQDTIFYFSDLSGAEMDEADLSGAKMYEANLSNAEMDGANLLNAEMDGANLSGAKMNLVENLTKEQILSAVWEHAKVKGKLKPNPPTLSDELERDAEIKKWLKDPYYNKPKDKWR